MYIETQVVDIIVNGFQSTTDTRKPVFGCLWEQVSDGVRLISPSFIRQQDELA